MHRLSQYDYDLPKELIAQTPVTPRSFSRLMEVKGERIAHCRFYQIAERLRNGDVLVLNSTKVLRARFRGRKSTGARVDMILTARDGDVYEARIRGGRVKPGNELLFNGSRCEVTDKVDDRYFVRFGNEKDMTDAGEMPTPWYVTKRLRNQSSYQTVFARDSGSLAAPTAGLHFTPNLLRRIARKGVTITNVTLHVSFSTFLPIRKEDYTQHSMHPERFSVSPETAEAINGRKGRLFVCGTTTMRALESCEWKGGLRPKSAETSIFIYPGHRYRTPADAMITNFHLPKSSLLLMVSAFAGKGNVMRAYAEAVRMGYRFYSFGDAMLLWHPQ